MAKVQIPEEEEIWSPELVEVAKVEARYMVRSEDRSPPPASPVPVLMARVDETIVKPRVRARSAERSPPPWMPPDVLMVLVDETIVKPRENWPV